MLQVPAVNLVAEERTLKGSYIGTSVPSRDLPRYLGLFQRGRLPVDRLLTDKLRLDQINDGFDRLREERRCARLLPLIERARHSTSEIRAPSNA